MADSPNTTSPSRRLFLAAGSATAVFAALGVAAAAQPEMTAERYIALWREAGNELAPVIMRGDRFSFCVGNENGMEFPSLADQYAMRDWQKRTPDYAEQIFEALVAEGNLVI